jgi:hypothetical protein
MFRVGEAQVDVCPADAGFILSIGATSIWIERAAAEDILLLLADALAAANRSAQA